MQRNRFRATLQICRKNALEYRLLGFVLYGNDEVVCLHGIVLVYTRSELEPAELPTETPAYRARTYTSHGHA